ncbi:MAG: fatty acid desaturase [Thermoplasmatota archaeon]
MAGKVVPMKRPVHYKGIRSLWIALIGMMLFSTSLVYLITLDIRSFPLWTIPLGTIWMTLMYTGLFITVHDSMHGSVLPNNRRANNFIGAMSIFFYAMFSYRKLKKKHFQHHKNPGTSRDPDYHDGKNKGFIMWYLRFMKNYLSPLQLVGIAIGFNFLIFVVGLPLMNMILFWALPSLGSTLQLFYFGTYLPHREPEGGYTNRHHARSSNFPYSLSLITCYHFGYHLEHHLFPYVQWWRLPWVRREMKRLVPVDDGYGNCSV